MNVHPSVGVLRAPVGAARRHRLSYQGVLDILCVAVIARRSTHAGVATNSVRPASSISFTGIRQPAVPPCHCPADASERCMCSDRRCRMPTSLHRASGWCPSALQTALYRGKAHRRQTTRLLSVIEFSGRDAFQQRVCSDRIAILSYEAATRDRLRVLVCETVGTGRIILR
jgi:hypothetical protein